MKLLTPGCVFWTLSSIIAQTSGRVYPACIPHTHPVRSTIRMVFKYKVSSKVVNILPLQCGQRFVKTAVDAAGAAAFVGFVVEAVLSPRAVGRMVIKKTVRRARQMRVRFLSITYGENSLDCLVWLREQRSDCWRQ